jgi:type IV pilus assembly protein PilV
MPSPKHANLGFSLIEVLIALLVISIGLVGIAGMHIFSLRTAHSSYQSTLASVIALDFEERLWERLGNDAVNGCPNFANVLAGMNTHWGRTGAPMVPAGRESTWPSADLASLPAFSVSLVGNTNPASPDLTTEWIQGTIRVQWAETRFGQTTEQFTYTARVPCRAVN